MPTNYTSKQFDASKYSEAQNQAYQVLAAVCGPEVAAAFGRFYGKNIDPDDIVNTARQYGLWTAQSGMRGPQAQKALLDRLGIPTEYSPEVNLNAVNDKLLHGYTAALSTPGHYFFLQGFDPATGRYDTGETGKAYRGGGQYLTADQMRQLGGQFQGQFLSTSGPGEQQIASVNQPAAPSAQVAYNDKNALANYIRYAAAQRGIDPEVAVKVASSEGLNTYVGDNNSSFGPFQLHYGNVASGGNAVAGMGDSFTKATGLDARDPNTVQAQIDYALDQAKNTGWGAWHGAATVGVGPRTGIGTYTGDASQYGQFNQTSNQTTNQGFRPGVDSVYNQGGLFGKGPVVQMGSQTYTPMGMFKNPGLTVNPPTTTGGLFGKGRLL